MFLKFIIHPLSFFEKSFVNKLLKSFSLLFYFSTYIFIEMEALEARNKEHFDGPNSMGITYQGNRVTFWIRCSILLYISSVAFVGQHYHCDTFGFICNCSGGKSLLIFSLFCVCLSEINHFFQYLSSFPISKEDSRKTITEREQKIAGNLMTYWEFEGYLKYSPLFYGYGKTTCT